MIKQVIVIRKDLKMRRGKEIAQGAHASQVWAIKALEALLAQSPVEMSISADELEWMRGNHKKVTVYVNSEAELLELSAKAKEFAHLTCHIIVDEGLTEFGGVRTTTCLALGPCDAETIDKITGHLPLY